MSRRPTIASVVSLVLVAVATVAAGWLVDQTDAPTLPGPVAAESAAPHSASSGSSGLAEGDLLDAAHSLRVVDQSRVGYDRDLFPHWTDPDGNGCDARNDVLQRDLVEVEFRVGSDCVVESGVLHDPFTGNVVSFQRGPGTSAQVQIDHVFPLAAAWTGGADTWSAQRREQFANDPENLLAVYGPANGSKQHFLPGESPQGWMPENEDFHCDYTAQVVHVATKYDLAVTEADRTAVISIAERCTP